MNSLEFYIKRISYSTGENIDLSQVPMLMRRKLSPAGKIALSTMTACYEDGIKKLCCASRYGELERVVKLIRQEHEENAISPAGFSFSVHNSTVGLFSLIKNLHIPYNSIAGGEDTFSSGLLDAVLNREKTLFCYAESVDRYESVSVLIDEKEGERVRISGNTKNLEPNSFTELIKGGRYICPLYILERV